MGAHTGYESGSQEKPKDVNHQRECRNTTRYKMLLNDQLINNRKQKNVGGFR